MSERHQARLKRQKQRERKQQILRDLKVFAGAFVIVLGFGLLSGLTNEIDSTPVDSDALTVTLEQNELTKPSDLQNAMTADQFQPTYNNLQGGLVRR